MAHGKGVDMDSVSIAGLSIAIFVLAASPGPGVFATIARALSTGLNRTLCLIAGIVFGDLVYLMLAIFGLSVIAHALGDLFTLVRIGGGIYLVWLGIKIWKSKTTYSNADRKESNNLGSGDFFTGLLITLSNPKVILFYCGFLPAFMDLKILSAMDITIVACVVASVVISVLTIYAYLASKMRLFFSDDKARKKVNRFAGGTMMAAGVAIAVKS
jgi:threonine/homoserine/homoserine lactone efflux protein